MAEESYEMTALAEANPPETPAASESAPAEDVAVTQAKQADSDAAREDEISDGVLDDILDRKESSRTEAAKKRQRREDGTFAPKEEAAAEPEVAEDPETADEETEATEEVAEAKDEKDVGNAEEYRKALHALSRENVPQSILDGMEPDEIIAWGKKRAEAQAEVDKFGQQLAELKNQTKEAQTETTDSQSAEPEFDLGDAAQPLLELFGDEASGPLKAFGSKVAQAATQQANQQFGEMQTVMGAVVQRLEQYEIRNARSELQKRFPQLKDDAGFDRAVAESQKLDASKFDSIQDMLATGSMLAFSEETIAEAAKKRIAMDKKKSMGSPTAQTRAHLPEAAKTEDDIEDSILDKILGG